MTAMGIAMVVAVFVMTLSIAQGFQSTLIASGSPQNTIIMRKGATSENVSAINRPELPLIQTFPQIARDAKGRPLASPELAVIIALPRKTNNETANVPVRGVGPLAFDVRENLSKEIERGRRNLRLQITVEFEPLISVRRKEVRASTAEFQITPFERASRRG